jgi:hypothetical protein
MREKRDNAITAAIDHLGGRSDGVKRIGFLLNVTTGRVYQLTEEGVVPKVDQAVRLSEATGWPLDVFLLRSAWDGFEPPGPGKRRRDPKAPSPMRQVGAPATGTGNAGVQARALPSRRKAAAHRRSTPIYCWSRSPRARADAPRRVGTSRAAS